MGMRHDAARNRIFMIDEKIGGVSHLARQRIGMRQHEPRHAVRQRRLADAGFAADQPGVRHALAAIGGEQLLLGFAMAEQHRGFARIANTVFFFA